MFVKRIIILVIFFFSFQGISLYGQRILITAENNILCFSYKIRGNNYLLEDGEVFFRGKKIAQTQRGCFDAPKKLCVISKTIDLVFYPELIKRYYNREIPFSLTGIKKRYSGYSEQVKCIPTNAFRYRGDEIVIKVKNYLELKQLRDAVPYVKNVEIKSQKLYKIIKPYVEGCSPQDITCLVNQSYAAVTQNLSYQEDPVNSKGGDYIRTPEQTIRNRGGDCEDLTGVLVSFLVNLNVESYVLMTTDHAYAMACGINPEQMEKYVRQGLQRTEIDTKTEIFKYGQYSTFYYTVPGRVEAKQSFEWQIKVQSQHPIDLFVIHGKVKTDSIRKKNFSYNRQCSGRGVTVFMVPCQLQFGDSLVFSYGVDYNDGKSPPPPAKNNQVNKIAYEIKKSYNLADMKRDFNIHFYQVEKNGKKTYCVVLEPSAGANGYPGFSGVKKKVSMAVNPVTWEWFYLKNNMSF